MGRGVAVFFILSAFLVLPKIMTAETAKVFHLSKWPALRSILTNYRKYSKTPYWVTMFCHMKSSPTIFVEGYLPFTGDTYPELFHVFIYHLYTMGNRCNAVSLSSSKVWRLPVILEKWRWLSKTKDCTKFNDSTTIPVVQDKLLFFNNPSIGRVMIITLSTVDMLPLHKFVSWNRNQYTVLLIITENDHEIRKKCVGNIKQIMRKISIQTLEESWKKYGAHNVFIGFPLLSPREAILWTYDPFYPNKETNKFGRLIEINPMMPVIPQRLRNLYGYKLDIGMFNSTLSSELHPKDKSCPECNYPVIGDFHGLDGYLVQTLSKYLNFTTNIVPPSGGIRFGHVEENGTAVGTLGDVAYRRIHASLNSQYIKKYYVENQNYTTLLDVAFTVPVDWDRVCIIVPSPKEIPKWLRTFIYLHSSVWLCLLATIILAAIVWYLLRNYHHLAFRRYSNSDKNYVAVFIDTLILLVGAPFRSRNVFGERILIGSLAFLGITVMGAFTGTLYRSFTKDTFYHPIETLKELDESGLLVATSSPSLYDIFGPKDGDDSPTFLRLAHKVQQAGMCNITTIRKTAYDRNVAAIYRENVFTAEQYRYVDSQGRGLLHLVSECPQAYYLAYLLPANSIFLHPFNFIITALREAGIIVFWIDKTIHQKINNAIKSKIPEEKNGSFPKAFSIYDMQTCFLILAFGLTISFIVFIFESTNTEFIKINFKKCIDMSKYRIFSKTKL